MTRDNDIKAITPGVSELDAALITAVAKRTGFSEEAVKQMALVLMEVLYEAVCDRGVILPALGLLTLDEWMDFVIIPSKDFRYHTPRFDQDPISK